MEIGTGILGGELEIGRGMRMGGVGSILCRGTCIC